MLSNSDGAGLAAGVHRGFERLFSGNHPLAGDGLSFERSPPFKPSSPEDSSHFAFAPKNGRLK
jgi:hypothetical protein